MFDALIKLIDVQTLITRFIVYLPNIFSALVLLSIFWVANKAVQKMLYAALIQMKIGRQAQGPVLRAARVALYIFAVLTVADQLKINIPSLLAGVGVMGLALSFAPQDTVGNIISGVVIIIDGPFKEGDWISISTHAVVLRENRGVTASGFQAIDERLVDYS